MTADRFLAGLDPRKDYVAGIFQDHGGDAPSDMPTGKCGSPRGTVPGDTLLWQGALGR